MSLSLIMASLPGGLFSRFSSKPKEDQKHSHSVHDPQSVYFSSGAQPSTGTTQTVVRETKSGATTYTKTTVTETTIGPNGQKRTVTRETVTSDNANGGADVSVLSHLSVFWVFDHLHSIEYTILREFA